MSMIPVLPPPVRGELFSSLLVRAAHGRGEAAWRFASDLVGAATIWDRDIDRSVTDQVLAAIAQRGEGDVEELRTTTLRAEVAALRNVQGNIGGDGATAITPMICSVGVRSCRRRRHGLAYCPSCLAQRADVFLKSWRLAFTVSCPEHAVWLIDGCPNCGAPVEPHRNLALRTDRCASCATRLSSALAIEASGPAVGLQAALMKTLERDLAGIPAPSPTLASPSLRDVRALCMATAHGHAMRVLYQALGAVPHGSWDRWPRIEFMRVEQRRELLRVVALWIAEGEDSFVETAKSAGLSQRRFARCAMSPTLAALVGRLDLRRGGYPDRGPPIHDDNARRLRRRRDPHYPVLRAERLMRELQTRSTT